MVLYRYLDNASRGVKEENIMISSNSVPDISIIVPVHNTENFVANCINSVCQQTYTDWELLLIDDGSKDRSGIICDEYVKKYPEKIRVWHIQNQGVSMARNIGLKHARGNWIKFLDSDDSLSVDALEKSIAQTEDCDMVCHGYIEFPKKRNCQIVNSVQKYETMANTFSDIALLYPRCFYQTIWNKLYKRSILIYPFEKDLSLGEDLLFNLANMPNAHGIKIIPDVLYNYRVEPSLISLSKSSDIHALELLVRLKHATDEAFNNQHQVQKLTSLSFLNNLFGKIELLVYDNKLSSSVKLDYLSTWLNSIELKKALVYKQKLSLIRRWILGSQSALLAYCFFRCKRLLLYIKRWLDRKMQK